jgi:glycosyltransferase involved in cell wall biosynthesis
LPKFIQAESPDVVVHLGGIASLSRNMPPQVLFLSNINYLQKHDSGKEKLRKKYTPDFLRVSKKVFYPNKNIAGQFEKPYGYPEKSEIVYAYPDANLKPPEDFQERQKIKDKFSEGKEYFLFSGEKNELMFVLKAFSIFKNKQKSAMKLLVATDLSGTKINRQLQSYKYREDVVLLDSKIFSDIHKITASAYAVIYPCTTGNFGMACLESFRAEVLLIAGKSSITEEIAEDACLFFDTTNQENLAAQMIRIYKDEGERKLLIAKGKERDKLLSARDTVKTFYEGIKNVCEQ